MQHIILTLLNNHYERGFMSNVTLQLSQEVWEALHEIHKETGINKATQLQHLINYRTKNKKLFKAYLFNVCANEMLVNAEQVNNKARELLSSVREDINQYEKEGLNGV